ncbi:hypothetical protein Hanom_Chr07g00609251 [Helianthus anomalus]
MAVMGGDTVMRLCWYSFSLEFRGIAPKKRVFRCIEVEWPESKNRRERILSLEMMKKMRRKMGSGERVVGKLWKSWSVFFGCEREPTKRSTKLVF